MVSEHSRPEEPTWRETEDSSGPPDVPSAAAADPGLYVAAGAEAMEEGRLDQAAGAFRKALALCAECGGAYAGLAMVYQRTEDYPAALEMYLQCLRHDPDNLPALLGLFQTSCRMGSFARIIRYLELYLAGHPDDASVLFCLAALHAREGRLALAERSLQKVLTLEPAKTEAAELLAKVRQAAWTSCP